MRRAKQLSVTLLTTLLATSLVAGGVAFGVSPVAAYHPSDAEDFTDESNFTVVLPHQSDHYPGNQNKQNASIRYNVVGAEAFQEQGAQDGLYLDWVIVHAEYEGVEWIDYSACSTDNTAAFGFDRGNNKSGYKYDEDLVSKQKKVEFKKGGIVINFYNWGDFAGDPPIMLPQDAIVAQQGAGSAAGPCLTMTEKPGWYQVTGFANGTVNDNARDEQPSDSAEYIDLQLRSTYVYVCECDSEQEAREQLGPPPNEGGPTTPTSTPTPAPTTETPAQTATPEENTPQQTATPASTEPPQTETPASTEPPQTQAPVNTEPPQTEPSGASGSGGPNQLTPTPGEGPGFGAVAALAALLASGLIALRRR
ncbi:PGF-CTERM sorting domain-containing protein [Natronomonas halophila]|uniref:PGF-CTERM sorting domain-containing protein n=1 Tax=Natronomonas halophila TaxID=2747817 RepID=UPI0015B72B03|nr:PGF-CTERM sorting domain-containing protein [Natronomonas halophila]QLD85732.1 PGF-CTERM sorting domain-containing protein [Natronomonas halophila]